MRLIAAFLLLAATALHAQNGKIVESAAIASKVPNVEIRKISYLSDDLTIAGYLAVPAGEGKVPCVIANRGGNAKLTSARTSSAARTSTTC